MDVRFRQAIVGLPDEVFEIVKFEIGNILTLLGLVFGSVRVGPWRDLVIL